MDGQVLPLHLATADPAGWDLDSALDLLPLIYPQAPALSGPQCSCLYNGQNVLLGPGVSGPGPEARAVKILGSR